MQHGNKLDSRLAPRLHASVLKGHGRVEPTIVAVEVRIRAVGLSKESKLSLGFFKRHA